MTTVDILHGARNSAPTMSSREIADMTNKEHKHVLRDIRTLRDQLGDMFGGSAQFWTHPQNGQQYEVFELDKDTCMTLLLGYNAVARMKVIKRWQELEAEQAKPVQLSRMDILQIAMQAEKERLIAIEQRDEAIRTKAEIGSRREATAMATASKAVQEMKSLRIQLSRSKDYQTVLAMQKKYGAAFVPTVAYFKLRAWCREHDHPPIDVPCDRYGQVKSWPAQAWMAVYGLAV